VQVKEQLLHKASEAGLPWQDYILQINSSFNTTMIRHLAGFITLMLQKVRHGREPSMRAELRPLSNHIRKPHKREIRPKGAQKSRMML